MKFRRYTNFSILLDMLVNKKITLLDPALWHDRNDSFFAEKYREKKQIKTLLALCFTTKPETFHHWKVFAGDSGGICIRFNAEKLLACFKKETGVKTGIVVYRLMRDLKETPPSIDELPFLKRKQYEDEAEFRIIYENKSKIFQTKDFQLDLGCIEKIILSPWLPRSVSKTIKGIVHQIPGCASMPIIRTGVVESLDWQKIAKNLP